MANEEQLDPQMLERALKQQALLAAEAAENLRKVTEEMTPGFAEIDPASIQQDQQAVQFVDNTLGLTEPAFEPLELPDAPIDPLAAFNEPLDVMSGMAPEAGELPDMPMPAVPVAGVMELPRGGDDLPSPSDFADFPNDPLPLSDTPEMLMPLGDVDNTPPVADMPDIPPPEVPRGQPLPAPDATVDETYFSQDEQATAINVMGRYREESRRWRKNMISILEGIVGDLQMDNVLLEGILRHFELNRRTPL